MRFLPDKPSLSFLRREAKDLLAALREAEPDASLTAAQQALAVQYGLSDWAALRAEADRLLSTYRPRLMDSPTPFRPPSTSDLSLPRHRSPTPRWGGVGP